MPQRQDRLTGGTVLYMNYTVTGIFTGISPKTSILLQIIHMTLRIILEFDRYRRASARTGSRTTIIRLPTDKEKTSPIQSLGGSFRAHPPLFLKKGRTKERGMKDP